MDLNHVFSNRSDKEKIYPLTVSEIAEEQTKDTGLQQKRRTSKFEETLIENTDVLCENGKMIVPKTLNPSKTCSSLVSPLLTTPRPLPLGRNFEGCNVLEKSTKRCPISCQNL